MVANHIRLRASAAPLFMKCGPSAVVVDGEVRVDPHNDAADLGSAIHQGLQDPECVVDDIPDPPDGMDADEYNRLVQYGRSIWRSDLSKYFKGGDVEFGVSIDLAGVTISGHIDRVAYRPHDSTLFILDWKSGRVDADYAAQLQMYALMVLRAFESQGVTITRVVVFIIRLRDFEFDVEHYTPDQLADFEERVIDRIGNAGDVYSPGAHCTNCQRNANCPGRGEFYDSALAVVNTDLGSLPEDPQERGLYLADTLDRVKFIEDICKNVRQRARDLVQEAGGSLPTTEGRSLKLAPTVRRSLDPVLALPVLQDKLTDIELAPCVKISVSKAEKAVMHKAGKGNGAEAKRLLAHELKEAGAVEENTSWTLRESKDTKK